MRRAPPAWMTIVETLWATTSCISRAIRRRSSATARVARRPRGARAAHQRRLVQLGGQLGCGERTTRPASQNITPKKVGKIRSPGTNGRRLESATASDGAPRPAAARPAPRPADARADHVGEEQQPEEQPADLLRRGQPERRQDHDADRPDHDRRERAAAADERGDARARRHERGQPGAGRRGRPSCTRSTIAETTNASASSQSKMRGSIRRSVRAHAPAPTGQPGAPRASRRRPARPPGARRRRPRRARAARAAGGPRRRRRRRPRCAISPAP